MKKARAAGTPLYMPLQPLFELITKLRTNYRHAPRIRLDRPSIVLSNHVTDWDPLAVGTSFAQPLSFVASEHILHWGVLSRIVKSVCRPIIRQKSTVASATALNIARRIRAGGNVCIFAEGDRTFNGVTGPMLLSTAKLIKMTGAQLVTFRLEGGYLASPRWARSFRRGRYTGCEIGRYTPEELSAMSPEEIDAVIARDLYEDAYARQRGNALPYRGKALAEGLETALYFCPRCGALSTLRTAGDRIFCACGLEAEYQETGFLRGEELPFDSVFEWDVWQRSRLLERLNDVTLRDEECVLYAIDEKGERTELTCGALSMTKDALQVGEKWFGMYTVSAVSICGRCRLVFSADGALYEIRRKADYNAYKYRTMFELLRSRAG